MPHEDYDMLTNEERQKIPLAGNVKDIIGDSVDTRGFFNGACGLPNGYGLFQM